jgi:hypothetical protein
MRRAGRLRPGKSTTAPSSKPATPDAKPASKRGDAKSNAHRNLDKGDELQPSTGKDRSASKSASDAMDDSIGGTGCFVADTPCWVSVPVAAAVAGGLSLADAHEPSSDFTEDSERECIPICDVPLGARVPTTNPQGADEAERNESYIGWKTVSLEVQHQNGSIVDVELLRSPDWIEKHGLEPGRSVHLNLSDIDTSVHALVKSIAESPVIVPAEGAVVIGRFMTRRSSELVRVTFEDGTQLTGTAGHPVWSVDKLDWKPLGEFDAGELVQGRDGVVAVALVEQLAARPAVFNIEVAGEHVYEVTELGILVHNSLAGFDCKRYAELLYRVGTRDLKPGSGVEWDEFKGFIKQLSKEDFGGLYRRLRVAAGLPPDPPAGMVEPHAHHILFKTGLGYKQKVLVAEGLFILLRHDIDPIAGLKSLVWAPNIKGQHVTSKLEHVLDRLRLADNNGKGTQADVLEALDDLADEAVGI